MDPEHDGALCNLAHLLLARRHATQIATQIGTSGVPTQIGTSGVPTQIGTTGVPAQIALQTSAMPNTTLPPPGTAEHSPGDGEHNATVPPPGGFPSTAGVPRESSTEDSRGTEQRAEGELRRVLRLALRANPERVDIAEAAHEMNLSVDGDSEGEGAQGGSLQG